VGDATVRTVQELQDLRGRTALVTGGAGHLGRAAADALAELGAGIVVLDLDPAACRAEADRLRAAHGVDALRQRILLTNQTINIDRFLLQQIERRREAPTTRADDRNLINHDWRRVEFRFSMKRRLQNQLPTRPEQFEREPEARRRT